MDCLINGVHLTKLKIIPNEKGNVMHALKKSDENFTEFGEAYFTFVKKNVIKGWKKHLQMTLNLLVPNGEVKFVLFDDRSDSKTFMQFFEIILSQQNYYRLTVSPCIWVAFKGIGNGDNLVLNIANIEHNPDEAINCEISEIEYKW